MAIPFVGRVYDDAASTVRLSDLMRRRGEIAGDRLLRQGEISGRMWQDLGQTIGDTVTRLGAHYADAPRREAEAAQIASQTAKLKRESRLNQVKEMIANLPPDTGITELRRMGFGDEATAMAKTLSDERQRAVSAMLTPVNSVKTAFGRGAAILSEVNKNPALWPELRPLLVDLAAQVAPDLANQIPAQYEPTHVRQITDFVIATASDVDRLARAAEKAREALKAGDDTRQSLDRWRQSIGTALSIAKTEQDWQALGDQYRNLHPIAATIVNSFGAFSPANVAKAQRATRDTRSSGSIEQQIADALRKGDTAEVTRLQNAAKITADARRAPESGSDKPITAAQRASAKRWKYNELQQAEEDFRKETKPYTHPIDPVFSEPLPPTAIPADLIEAHEARKRRIQASYLDQIGDTSVPRPKGPPTNIPPPRRGEPIASSARDPFFSDTVSPPAPSRSVAVQPAAPPAPPAPPATPLGATPATAVPTYTVGQVVTVRGQRVRITKINPDGTFEGEPVP